MEYNFDQIIDRTNSNCQKYDNRKAVFGTTDLIPMWVADTDFKTPDFIVNAVKKRAEHQVYGYPLKPDSYFESIMGWYKRRHNWDIKKNWIQFCPNVVSGIASLVLSLSSEGDKIIVQPPVYFPFFHVVEGNKRVMVENPLKREGNRYSFDFDNLKSIIDEKTKMILLCSPHNPGGMVWTREELSELGKICIENGIIVIADEIHADLIFSGHTHIPFPSISDEFAMNSIIVSSASKTFNIAGLSSAYIIAKNPEYRKAYEAFARATHITSGNFFGQVATEAAYNYGESWLDQLILYIEENYNFIESFIKNEIPCLKLIKPEGTFLAWIDFSEVSLPTADVYKNLIDNGLGLSPGHMFGEGGKTFLRLNMGCPRSLIVTAMDILKRTIESI